MAESRVITKENVTEVVQLPGKVLNIFDGFMDLFRKEQTLRIEWTSPDYKKTEVLRGWLYRSEKGEKRVFEVRGKPAFVKAVVSALNSVGTARVLSPTAKNLTIPA